jgi:hypothetical protein
MGSPICLFTFYLHYQSRGGTPRYCMSPFQGLGFRVCFMTLFILLSTFYLRLFTYDFYPFTSKASLNALPKILNASTISMMATPGTMASIGLLVIIKL